MNHLLSIENSRGQIETIPSRSATFKATEVAIQQPLAGKSGRCCFPNRPRARGSPSKSESANWAGNPVSERPGVSGRGD